MKATRKILTEGFVQNNLIKYLKKQGWSKSLKSAELWEHGVDIKVRNNKFSRYWLIEVKGDPSVKVKSVGGSRSSAFNSALGQIVTRMHRDGKRVYKYGYKYGIAFPNSFRSMVINKMPFDIMDKLNLFVFFVEPDGKVEEISWRAMKKMTH